MGDGLHLARETHACAARPATGVPVTMFSSWRLFSEELPTADIPGLMMRLGARHLNVQKCRYCHGYLSQNLHCGVTRGVTRSWLHRLAAARCYAGAFVSTGRYQVRESWRKCPRLFPYCDIDSALNCTYSDPSFLRPLLRTLILLAIAVGLSN